MTGPAIGEGGRREGGHDEDVDWEWDDAENGEVREGGQRQRDELPEYVRREGNLPSYNRTIQGDLRRQEMENLQDLLFYRPNREERRRSSRVPNTTPTSRPTSMQPDRNSVPLSPIPPPSPRPEPPSQGEQDLGVLSIEDYERRTRRPGAGREDDGSDDEAVIIPVRTGSRASGLPPRYSLDVNALPQEEEPHTRSPSPSTSGHQPQPSTSGSSLFPRPLLRTAREGDHESHLSVDSVHTLCSKEETKGKEKEEIEAEVRSVSITETDEAEDKERDGEKGKVKDTI